MSLAFPSTQRTQQENIYMRKAPGLAHCPRMPYPSGIAEIRNLEVVPRVEHKHPTPRRLKGRELVPGLPLSPIPACRELTSLPLR